MDIFKLLSRGSSIKHNTGSVQTKKSSARQKAIEGDFNQQIDKELDFFHTRKLVEKQTSKENDNPNNQDDSQPNNTLKFETDQYEGEGEGEDKNNDESEIEDKIPMKITTKQQALNLRKSYKCKISGDDIPLPIASFEDLISRFKFNKTLLNNLIESGFDKPTPIQSETIPIFQFNRDLIACAPTGSGKTLAFLLPLIQKLLDDNLSNLKAKSDSLKGIKALIISPTKELANQIFNESLKLINNFRKTERLNIGLLSKSLASKFKNKIINNDKYDILITTPLRLIDLLNHDNSISLSNIKYLVFDEADKLFDKNFLEQSDNILSKCNNGNKNFQKLMFSATIPSSVEEIARNIMISPIRVIIGNKESANDKIEQKVLFCGSEEGKLLAIRQMIQNSEFKPPVIIFLQSVIRVKALFHELLYDRLNVDYITAERTQLQRDKVIERFKNGDIWCLICTDVLSRGIDFKGVNLVINYDVPNSAQSYIHRIGRTARGNQFGKAVTFFTKEDSESIRTIINVMKHSGSEYSEWLEKIPKLSKKQKKNFKKNSIDRKEISTVPKIIRKKRKQHKEMVEASKRRKHINNDKAFGKNVTGDSDIE
ncbi:RNA-dependent ATPase ROK1 [Ascoidea rubescens DSM 1968]|uniref:RNA helicase n=1 Tax=Ascoidea rubescens DSM 1968 TaxID=1344418 RepID=A0A1D2VFA5_9ASCO|nr:DEAD box RNA helicase [Ascoidea rubescens DSM 1968]ODV60193.1 DEAD box RNA helicase [Ascoidea rubescens DSM 1968]